MSRPATMTEPRVGDSSPAMIRSVVVLPLPLGPMREMNSPSSMVRSRSCSTTVSPNFFETSIICKYPLPAPINDAPWCAAPVAGGRCDPPAERTGPPRGGCSLVECLRVGNERQPGAANMHGQDLGRALAVSPLQGIQEQAMLDERHRQAFEERTINALCGRDVEHPPVLLRTVPESLDHLQQPGSAPGRRSAGGSGGRDRARRSGRPSLRYRA